MSCKSQNKNYKVLHLSNNQVEMVYYFHPNNEEFARVYGNSIKNDSLAFIKEGNSLIVKEFNYDENRKERINSGTINYVNYYTKLTEIIPTENATSINEVPIKNSNFIKKDFEIENLSKENCRFKNELYSNCDFILPKDNELPYLPSNSTIISVKIKKSQNNLQELDIVAKYFEKTFNYNRKYYYHDNKIEKISTLIEDSISKTSYKDHFLKVK